MSHGGGIVVLIRSIEALMDAISDLKLAQEKMKQIETADGKIYKVDVAVKDENNKLVGFQKQKDGSYKIIADSRGLNTMQLKKQQQFVNSIKKRYAYNMIIKELNKQGYQIAEEKQVENDTVKIIARRWVG
jgi:hypothetical protein